jgi:transposase
MRKMSVFERLSGPWNRKQRRAWGQRLGAADPGLKIVNPNAGGIDLGKASHYGAVPSDRDAHPVQEFGCWTADVVRLAKWLPACRMDTVAVQATGVYWIGVYDILTQHGIRVVLVNAPYTKNVPGRKSDVQECQWLMKLHTYGLLRDSFRLASHREGVRTLWRLRGRHVEEAGREVQPMPKALTKMNIQWANAISDISGGSGQAIIGAILKGERDPYQLADLRHERVQASREEIARRLEGNWREDLIFELQQAVDGYRFVHRQMQECDQQLESYLASLPTRMPDVPHSTAEQTAAAPQKVPQAKKAKKPKGNAPGLDLQAYLKRICGVDLTTIEGIDVMTAMRVLSETGADMREFPTEDNFTGWLGLTPSPPISGGKVIGPGRGKVQNRLAQALRIGGQYVAKQ